jgi:TRAP-type C4-dicarboxylate transport system substrate-binding protein
MRSTDRGVAAATALAGAAVFALGMSVAAAQTYEMKLGFVTINDSQHESAKIFAEEIAKRTNGALQARVFPAGQLGNIARQIEGLQLGTQEAFYTPPGFMVGINPAFQAADAPGLFESIWHNHKALNHPTMRDKFLGLAEHANIAGVYTWSAGPTGIASRGPIRTVGDIKGLKLRVLASKVEVGYVKSLEATGVPMDFTEVLPAIQNRTLDGTRIGIVVLAPSKFYSAAKYLYHEATGYVPTALWVSKSWIEKLPAAHRKAIYDVGSELTDRTGLIGLDLINRLEKVWIDNGGEVTRPTPADKAEMLRRARLVAEEILGGDPKVKDMYALVKQAAEATRGMQPPQR